MDSRALPKRPSARATDAIDRAIQEISPADERLAEWYPAYARNHARRIAHDLDLVLDHLEHGGLVLDVGCVPPLLIAALRSLGHERVEGLDIDPSRFSDSIEALGLSVHKADIECGDWGIEPGSCSVIVFNEVFEHLRIDPIKTLRQALQSLRPDGVLLLSTPNLYSAAGIFNFLLRGRAHACAAAPFDEYSKLDSLGHMGHVREYTLREIVDFLEALGFEVTEVIHRGRSEVRQVRWLERVSKKLRPFVSLVARPKVGG